MAREIISKIYFRAVEIYHNRQLDGKPMKCTMVGVNKYEAALFFLPTELYKGVVQHNHATEL